VRGSRSSVSEGFSSSSNRLDTTLEPSQGQYRELRIDALLLLFNRLLNLAPCGTARRLVAEAPSRTALDLLHELHDPA